MKYNMLILISFILLTVGCSREPNQIDKDDEKLKKPDTTILTQSQIKKHIEKEINIAIDLGNENIIREAADVIALTRTGLTYILDEKYAEAIETINRAIAKARLIEMGPAKRIVTEVDIEVIEHVNDAEAAYGLINRIDSLMENGEFQKAKCLMGQLTNELRITRENISISNVLQSLKNIDQFLKAKQYENALLELNNILDGVSAERSITPLPLIIAQRMINEMEALLEKENPNKEEASILLVNAEYQLQFSELLGYGKNHPGYETIFDRIETVQKELESEEFQSVRDLIAEVRTVLNNLQKDIAEYKTVNENGNAC